MTTVEPGIPVCPHCGSPLPAGASTHGMCPRCAWSVLDGDGEEVAPGDLMTLPGLRVVSEIARGGMGVVYRAVEAGAGRDVAVKMMQPALADSAEVRDRFAQEARAMGALDHPGILPVYRVGAYHGLPFFTMKLAEQGTLSQRLTRYANDWRNIAELMAAVAEAVHYAHQRGLLHRDLKPANILFDATEHAYVSDFGLVKLTAEDSSLTHSITVLGTPHYMAPEVAERDARAARVASDVWSLGAMLYELMAQRLAFEAEGVPALLRRIVEEDPAPLPAAAPRDLATIALKCLHKTPAQRYGSAGALADDLHRWLRGEPVTARRLSATERVLRWCRRKPALAGMAGLLILSIAVGGALIVAKNRALSRTLRTSLLNEAHAIRSASSVQGRDAGLRAVRKAARLDSSPELEVEAASLLALSSMKLTQKIPTDRYWAKMIPDADLINAADFTHEDGVRVIELSSGRELAKLPPGRPYISSHDCMSDDGRLLLSMHSTDRKLIVCEWRTGRVVREFEWTTHWGAHFSPDSQALVFGNQDGSIERHDLADQNTPPVTWPPGEVAPATPFAFSPDGRWLAVMGDTHLLSVLDAKTGRAQCTFGLESDGRALSACWSGDSLSIMLGTVDGVVRSWSMSEGPSRLLAEHSAQVFSVAVHPQGQFAVSSAYERRSWILDWPGGQAVGMEMGSSMYSRFSRDGRRFALHDEGLRVLKLYEIASPEVCRQFVPPDLIGGKRMKKGSWCALVRPGGRLLAAGTPGTTHAFNNGGAIVWRANYADGTSGIVLTTVP